MACLKRALRLENIKASPVDSTDALTSSCISALEIQAGGLRKLFNDLGIKIFLPAKCILL